MAPDTQPQLASMAVLVRDDGRVLMLRHAAGPFAERWSMPFIGVAEHETAEDALERLLRDALHVRPGPYEFLDTLYLTGAAGDRFVVNAFTCVKWGDEPRYGQGIYDDAVWAPPDDAGAVDLIPELQEWLATTYEVETGTWGGEYDPAALRAALADARGELVAAYETVPPALRHEAIEGDWSPLDVLAHAVDVEAYYLAETRRSKEPGHTWRVFNDAQWSDLHRLRPAEDDDAVRERMEAVRAETLAWLEAATPATLGLYVNHPERGVVQLGDRIDQIARHDREHAGQLRRMARVTDATQSTTS